MRTIISMLALSVAFSSQAAWTLDSAASSLRFASVKNDTVAEIHNFSKISGSWQDNGQAQITIDVASLDTLVPIRNERMRTQLFEESTFPQISATAQINPALVKDMAVGSNQQLKTELKVTIRDQSQTLNAELAISKLSDGRIVVNTVAPILVNAVNFKLEGGVAKLKDLAKLQRIELVVPVTFLVTLNKN
jgi:polyisoprenoid-binding protein YceI